MSVFQTAYQTSACAGTVTSKIVEALIRARIENYIRPEQGYSDLYLVRRDRFVDELVPTFAHPIVSEASGEKIAYVDVRAYGKQLASTLEFEITNTDGYAAATLRGRLQQIWMNGGQAALRDMRLPAAAFPSWISTNICKRLNLGPAEQATIQVLAGIYYLSLFRDGQSDDKGEVAGTITQVSRNTGIKPQVAQDIVERHPYIANINEFCDVVKEEIQNVRLNNLNTATLFPIMAGTWYGANSAEMVAVALEHPPTWVTMVFQAVTARSYYHSGLAKMLEQNQYKREVRQFTISLRESD